MGDGLRGNIAQTVPYRDIISWGTLPAVAGEYRIIRRFVPFTCVKQRMHTGSDSRAMATVAFATAAARTHLTPAIERTAPGFGCRLSHGTKMLDIWGFPCGLPLIAVPERKGREADNRHENDPGHSARLTRGHFAQRLGAGLARMRSRVHTRR